MLEVKIEQQSHDLSGWLEAQDAYAELADVVQLFADAAVEISTVLRHAALKGQDKSAGSVNVQGEEQKQLDIISHDITLAYLAASPNIAALVSEEVPDLIVPEGAHVSAPYIVCFDPLDGSSNLEINGAVGSIFSVLRRKNPDGKCTDRDVLESAFNQLVAGYVLYGPATLLVLTTGDSVALFALDDVTGSFVLVQDSLQIPSSANEFAINMAHQRHWEAPVCQYIRECIEGETGPRGRDFNMRWTGAMVADVHRLFMRGGIFIYPALNRPGGENGKLRFLYEANPMAWLVEVAGGKAISSGEPLRGNMPGSLHQRVPVAIGSADEVARLAAFYID